MEISEANDICQSDLIYVPGPISDKSNCFKLKKIDLSSTACVTVF